MAKEEDNVQLKETDMNHDTDDQKKKPLTNETSVDVEEEKEKLFHYDVFENPPVVMTFVFAIQV
jgi:hypothetical protein